MLEEALVLLLALSWIYWLAACWMVRAFFRQPRNEIGIGGAIRAVGRIEAGDGIGTGDGGPGETCPAPAFAPPVSILKPVRGLDHEAAENFESFCRQDYPDYEVIFGVAEADDPVVPVIRRLQRKFPSRRIRLVFAAPFGANRKACLLRDLATAARHGILVISDSDTRVAPDYLGRVVAPLADPGVGLVTSPYVAEDTLSLPAGLEALHMGVTFLPSIIVARRVLAMRFAMGASISLRRADLSRLGGFEALCDYLAEDYQIGARMAALGKQVHLSDYVMVIRLGKTTFPDEWHREVRWMRCARVSRPLEYPTLLLTFSTPLAGALAWVSGFDPATEQALVVTLVLRWLVGWLIAAYTGDRISRRWLPWLPVRDVLSAAVWVAAAVGRRVVWRGEEFELLPGGRMKPAMGGRDLGIPSPSAPGMLAAGHRTGEGAGHRRDLDPPSLFDLDDEALEGDGAGSGCPAEPLSPHS